jgi:hypothetical protein
MKSNNNLKKIMLIFIILLMIPSIMADEISISLKRTNPGIATIKSAEMIFDIVNLDTEYNIEGFILCRSPDDLKISSTLGLGSGSGAQYISPKFEMNTGPSQKAVYLTVESNYKGDYNTNCLFKYIPYKMENEIKTYQKINLDITTEINYNDYRQIRLDKSIPFVEASGYVDIFCPNGLSSCNSSEVILIKQSSSNLFLVLSFFFIVGIGYLIFSIYSLKK